MTTKLKNGEGVVQLGTSAGPTMETGDVGTG